MMSLTSANVTEVVKKQLGFKLKANIDAFSSLVGLQSLAMLFSFGGVSTYGISSNYFDMDVKFFSADLVIIFTMLWAFGTAITITTMQHRNQDFTFVTNRLSSGVSNVLFLLAASILGGVTAVLSSFLLRVAGYFVYGPSLYGAEIVVGELLVGVFVTILYVFMASSIGYFIGTLTQVSKVFIILTPALIVGTLFLDTAINRDPVVQKLYQFYFTESSLLLFFVKILLTAAIFFVASISLLNRMEVRR
jgi:hypothetical protein